MNVIRVLGFIAALANFVLGIYDHNFAAYMGWCVASLYMGVAMIEGFIET